MTCLKEPLHNLLPTFEGRERWAARPSLRTTAEEYGIWAPVPRKPSFRPSLWVENVSSKQHFAVVRNKAISLALRMLPDGTRDILGLWIENTEGVKFWIKVFNDLPQRDSRH